MQKYNIIGNLGDGSYGLVRHAVNLQSKEEVAIKQIKRLFDSWEECLQLKEIKSLQKICHPNVIRLKEVLKVDRVLHLVFEYAQKNLLQLYSGRKLKQQQAKKIMFQAVLGLDHINKSGFFHRDLKPQNILLKDGQVKICDFGLAKQIRSKLPYTEYVSTRWYRAPEQILFPGHYNASIDIFALGCIFFEICTGTPLFPGTNDQDQLFKIVKALGSLQLQGKPTKIKLHKIEGQGVQMPDISQQGNDLLRKMLNVNSAKRIAASQILKHQFFRQEMPKVIATSQTPVNFRQSNQSFFFQKQIKDQKPVQIQMRKSVIKPKNKSNFKNFHEDSSWDLLQKILQEVITPQDEAQKTPLIEALKIQQKKMQKLPQKKFKFHPKEIDLEESIQFDQLFRNDKRAKVKTESREQARPYLFGSIQQKKQFRLFEPKQFKEGVAVKWQRNSPEMQVKSFRR